MSHDGGVMAKPEKRNNAAQRAERYIDAMDLISEAKRRLLLTQLLIAQVVAIVGESRLDERLTVLVYASERSTNEALEAVELALVALK
jgi:hypothetical protein